MTTNIVRDALRALQIAVALEIPLALAWMAAGVPNQHRPNLFSMLPSIAHVPGVWLLGPIQRTSPIVSGATYRLPLADIATFAAGNVIMFSLGIFIYLRFWKEICEVADLGFPRS